MQEKKYFILLFSFSFLVLLVFAYLFAVERVLFEDASIAIFKLLNYKRFYITNHRFISALIEIPALIGVKYNASVKTIVYLFSYGYFLPELFIIISLVFILEDYKSLLVLLLLLVVLNNFGFYYTYAEYHKGINLSVLFFSMVYNEERFKEHQKIYNVCLAAIYIVILFCHPLMCIIFFFIYLYFYVEKKIDAQTLKRSVAFILITTALKTLLFRSSYDTQKMKLSITFIKDNKMLEGFSQQLFHHNFVFALFFIFAIFILVRQKKRKLLLLFSVFSFGYFTMICMVFGRGTFDYYGEYLFKPLVFFVAIVIVHQSNFKLKANQLFFAILVVISLSKIYHYRKILTDHTTRYKYILSVMHTNNIKKALISKQKGYNFDLFDDRWASSFESVLLDKIIYNSDTSSTFCITYCMSCCIENNQKIRSFIDNDEITYPPYFNLPQEKFIVIDSLLVK